MESQGGDPPEVVLRVEPHLQVVLGVESREGEPSEVVLEVEPHYEVVLRVGSQRDSEVVE